jgi:hypothetical protein
MYLILGCQQSILVQHPGGRSWGKFPPLLIGRPARRRSGSPGHHYYKRNPGVLYWLWKEKSAAARSQSAMGKEVLFSAGIGGIEKKTAGSSRMNLPL